MELFLDAWFDPDRHDLTRHVARHLIVAHHRGTTIEAKIMLVHAALEYLSWVTYVLPPGTRSESHHDRNDMLTGAPPSVWHLQELLDEASVDTAIPAGLVAMHQRAQQMRPTAHANRVIDGPEVLMWLRNRLVHPKDAGEPYRIEDLVTEAWRLVIEYGELLLLHRIGYNEVLTANNNRHGPVGEQRARAVGNLSGRIRLSDHERGLPLRGRRAAQSLIVCCRQSLVAPTYASGSGILCLVA